MQWELAQIAAGGPAWKEQAAIGELEADVAGGEGAGVAAGGAAGGIPEFGGGEAEVGEEPGAEGDTDVEVATDVEPI